MSSPATLPELLRRAEDLLTGMTDARDGAHTVLQEIIAHPALAPTLAEPPAREPATPPVSLVVLAKLICEAANQGTPVMREDGARHWSTNCIAVQRLAFLAHGYHLAWYGEPLVDEEFEPINGGPSLASLRALPGWGHSAEDAEGILAADTFPVARRHRAVVKAVVDAHGTWGKLIDERLAQWPVVVDGDFSQAAVYASFLLRTSRKERTALSNRQRPADRADAIESMVDADTRAELQRRWLTAG